MKSRGDLFFEFWGLFGLLVVYVFIFVAIANAPWFSFTGNALSDLGVREGSGFYFNFGLVLGGFFLCLYVLSLVFRDSVFREMRVLPGVVFLFLTGLFLALVGVFTEEAGVIHFFVAFGFFLSFPLAAVFLSFGLWRDFRDRFLVLLAVVALVVFFVGVLFPWRSFGIVGLAIPELLLAFFDTVWLAYFSYRRVKG